MGKEETELQKKCLDYARSKNIPCTRHNVYKPGYVKYYATPESEKGWGDILICMPPYGQLVNCEIKTPTGKMKDSQIIRRIEILEAGGASIKIETLNQFKEFIANYEKSEHFISLINRIHSNLV